MRLCSTMQTTQYWIFIPFLDVINQTQTTENTPSNINRRESFAAFSSLHPKMKYNPIFIAFYCYLLENLRWWFRCRWWWGSRTRFKTQNREKLRRSNLGSFTSSKTFLVLFILDKNNKIFSFAGFILSNHANCFAPCSASTSISILLHESVEKRRTSSRCFFFCYLVSSRMYTWAKFEFIKHERLNFILYVLYVQVLCMSEQHKTTLTGWRRIENGKLRVKLYREFCKMKKSLANLKTGEDWVKWIPMLKELSDFELFVAASCLFSNP